MPAVIVMEVGAKAADCVTSVALPLVAPVAKGIFSGCDAYIFEVPSDQYLKDTPVAGGAGLSSVTVIVTLCPREMLVGFTVIEATFV
jgi:hypothetical protein